MKKEKKLVTAGGFIGNFIIDFLIWNFILGLLYNLVIAFLSVANENIGGVVNIVGIPLLAWITIYISICRVFSGKDLNINDAKNAILGVAIIVVIFAVGQFFYNYSNLVASLQNPWASGTYIPSSMNDTILTQGVILSAVQNLVIIVAIPFASKWIKRGCIE